MTRSGVKHQFSEAGEEQSRKAKHASQIEIAGKVFEYLDLAKPDERSHLGWRLTPPGQVLVTSVSGLVRYREIDLMGG